MREKLSQINKDTFESQIFEQSLEKRSCPGNFKTEERWKCKVLDLDFLVPCSGNCRFWNSFSWLFPAKQSFFPDHSWGILGRGFRAQSCSSGNQQSQKGSGIPQKEGKNPPKVRENTQKCGQKNPEFVIFYPSSPLQGISSEWVFMSIFAGSWVHPNLVIFGENNHYSPSKSRFALGRNFN